MDHPFHEYDKDKKFVSPIDSPIGVDGKLPPYPAVVSAGITGVSMDHPFHEYDKDKKFVSPIDPPIGVDVKLPPYPAVVSAGITGVSMDHPSHEYYKDEKFVATLFGLSVRTIQRWRLQNRGPRYRRIGNRVRYSLADIRAWADACPVGAGIRRRGAR